MQSPRVLSIQSHVVRGYVGNKSALFPLQLLGFEVDPINSVQLSNHTGYKVFKGQILDENDLRTLIDSLRSNSLLHYTHLLTGYIGSPSFLHEIASVVKEVKRDNPDLLYVCDPVMGDNDEMYVPESLLPIYRDTILPLADVLTPNQFELEWLCGRKIKSVDEAWQAIDTLHAAGCRGVIVSSSIWGDSAVLIALASWKTGEETVRLKTSMPKLDGRFVGTGDLFAALILAWLHKSNGDIQVTMDNTVATVQAVLKRTVANALALSSNGKPTPEQMELQLVQSKLDIESPSPTIKSVIVKT